MNTTSHFCRAVFLVVLFGCIAQAEPNQDWRERAEEICQARLADAWDQSERGRQPATVRQPIDRVEPADWSEVPRFSLAAEGTETNESSVQPVLPEDEPALSVENQAEKGEQIKRGPLPGFRETLKRDLQEAPGVLWSDTKAAFGDPWNLVLLAGAGGASIALRTTNADYHIDEDWFGNRRVYNSCWADTFGALGNPATHFALAGAWYLAGQQMQDAKTYEVGKKLFSALTITGTATMFLKVAAWDDSPNGEWGAWPSGHVSSTMAVATVLNGAYGPLVGVPMFGLTALVGVERMDSREHWMSDVVFGAVLGWVVGETVFKEHRPEIMGGEVVPYVDPVNGGAGVAWVKPLGGDGTKSASR